MLTRIRKLLQGNKGFTLIELIVVISIIAILLVLAIPRLTGYTEQAKKTADDQLATLYKNTFTILVGSGQAVVSPASVDTVDVVINKDGSAASSTYPNLYAADGTALVISDVQTTYIAQGGVNSSGLPGFQSRDYSHGAVISITSSGAVTVTGKTAP